MNYVSTANKIEVLNTFFKNQDKDKNIENSIPITLSADHSEKSWNWSVVIHTINFVLFSELKPKNFPEISTCSQQWDSNWTPVSPNSNYLDRAILISSTSKSWTSHIHDEQNSTSTTIFLQIKRIGTVILQKYKRGKSRPLSKKIARKYMHAANGRNTRVSSK